jgi:hypothetical protein
MNDELQWLWKDASWPDQGIVTIFAWRDQASKITNILSQDIQYPEWESVQEPHE